MGEIVVLEDDDKVHAVRWRRGFVSRMESQRAEEERSDRRTVRVEEEEERRGGGEGRAESPRFRDKEEGASEGGERVGG